MITKVWGLEHLGPIGVYAYDIVTAADLRPFTTSNRTVKFANDRYLVVPASNSSSGSLKLLIARHGWLKTL